MEEYFKLAERTEKMFPTVRERLIHCGLGLGSEVGEVYEDDEGGEVDEIEEIADVLWYMAILFNTVIEYHPISFPVCMSNLNMPLNNKLSAAVGQVIGIIKKHVIYGRDLDVSDLQTKAFRVLMIADTICRSHGETIHDACNKNIAKLQKRYPEKYTDEASLLRADKQG